MTETLGRNVGIVRLPYSPDETVNDLVAAALERLTWSDPTTPLIAFMLQDVSCFEGFASAVGPAWEAADRPDPCILFPRSLRIDADLFEPIHTPTMHLFALTKAATKPLRLACASDCPKTLLRLLGLNPQIARVAVPCDPPGATYLIHGLKPYLGEDEPGSMPP